MHNSTLFYDTYIKNNPFVNLTHAKQLRIETTLKDKGHWKSYGIEITTLEDLLELDLTKHLDIFKRPINHYMSGDKVIFHRATLTPSDKEKLMLIELVMFKHSLNEISAIEHICEKMFPSTIPKNKNARSRHKKKLRMLAFDNKKKEADILNDNQLNIISELEKIEIFEGLQ